jgi:hypothetical protein
VSAEVAPRRASAPTPSAATPSLRPSPVSESARAAALPTARPAAQPCDETSYNDFAQQQSLLSENSSAPETSREFLVRGIVRNGGHPIGPPAVAMFRRVGFESIDPPASSAHADCLEAYSRRETG